VANINLRCELITGLAYDGEEEVEVDAVKAPIHAPKKAIWHTITRIFGIILWGFSLEPRSIERSIGIKLSGSVHHREEPNGVEDNNEAVFGVDDDIGVDDRQ